MSERCGPQWVKFPAWCAERCQAAAAAGAAAPGLLVRRVVLKSLRQRDESDPERCTVELVQRGRMIVDVSAADLDAAETALGAFHPTTWYFRNAWMEAQRSWDELRAKLGASVIEAALEHPSLTVLALSGLAHGSAQVLLVSIGGHTYRAERVVGTDLAPVQWRLVRLHPPLDHGPYYACRLADGSTQCDCADWTYRIAETDNVCSAHCKHLAALAALGWL